MNSDRDIVSTALLGCGRIGRLHAQTLDSLDCCRLVKIYDSDISASRACAAALAARKGREGLVCEEVEEIFAAPSIDALVVASTTETHCDYIERGVKAGKAVFCEKPLDLDLGRAFRLVDFLSSCSCSVQLGFNRRFDPGHRATRAVQRAGEIGALSQIVITSRDPALPSAAYLSRSGGIFRDMTIHDLDMARFMLPEEPTEVFATASALLDAPAIADLQDFDCTMVVLRTPSGIQCHINNSRQAVYGYDQRVELLGKDGMLLSDNRRGCELRRFGKGSTECSEGFFHFFTERYAESFRLQFESFFSCVGSRAVDRRFEVDADDGFRALLLAECCYRSLSSGGFVKVSEIAAEHSYCW